MRLVRTFAKYNKKIQIVTKLEVKSEKTERIFEASSFKLQKKTLWALNDFRMFQMFLL